ncbi:MAG: hypothetical protein ABR915_03420 [Thermoguttaceae bacterium]|jgi:hypothetical protein
MRFFLWSATVLALQSMISPAAADEAAHPFMLWTKDEAARVRKLVETEPWAKAAYERETSNLVRYGVMGDRAAGAAEKALLLKDLAAGKAATRGNAYRYDVLHDLLSPEERTRIRQSFVERVEQAMESMAERRFTRWNWLPNLGYAWYSDLHAVAAATGDRQLVRKMFHAPNAFKWYLDEYLSDLGFYNEEFSKMFNTPQGLVAWCWALERLGMDELGWGYTGRQGATVRGHIDSILRIGMPRVDLGTDRYFYPRLTIGDTRGGGYPALGFQHPIVGLPNVGGPARFDWYRDLLEYAHAKWPKAGYGYFLAQMRAPGEKVYAMPLRFGVPPIDPAGVKPPSAPSGVYPGRGLIVLRAEEGPEYWESPAPAVGLRLATPYGHFVHDSFCLTGFYAFNRPLMVNHAHATNYTGVDPCYSNSARSHSIVIVDRAEPKTLADPNAVAIRHEFTPRVKFVAARAKGIFEGVDQTRVLMLTREYLLDVSRLASDHPRDYLWQIHAIGHASPDSPSSWTDSADLMASLPDLGFEQSCATDKTWAVTMVQSSGGANRQYTPLGPRWFEDRIGVRTIVLGEPGTRAYVAWAPVVSDTSGQWRGRSRFAFGEDEPAGAAIVANRKAAVTTFIAVHEPLKTIHRIRSVRKIANSQCLVGVAVQGDNFTDYLFVHMGTNAGATLAGHTATESYLLTNYAYVRATNDRVDIEGELKGMIVPVVGKPRLFVRGQETPATIANGRLTFGEGVPDSKAGATGTAAENEMPAPALAARWQPPTGLCLPTGGKGTTTLKLRNNTLSPITAHVALVAPKGTVVSPDVVSLQDFAPGAERDVPVTIDAAKAPANVLAEIFLRAVSGKDFDVPRAALKVAHGVAHERAQVASEFHETIYSPRYIAKFWYMDSGAATELLDPLGYRRNDSSAASYPRFVRTVAEGNRLHLSPAKVPKFAYFIPILNEAGAGTPRYLYEGGRHAHGTQSGLEHRFTEDWILVRDRTAKPGEEVAFDWLGGGGGINGLERTVAGRDPAVAADKMPGKLIVFDEVGKPTASPLVAGKGMSAWPKDTKGVAAVFFRPDGYEHGSAMFYPPGSRLKDNYVYQPAERPMGFTFCTEAELPQLAKKWLENMPTGEVARQDAARYNGAFMAQPVKAE